MSMADFSIIDGGLISRFIQRTSVAGRMWTQILVLVAIAWLPLPILSALDGRVVSNADVPFLFDYGVYGRLLIAVPVLLGAEIPVGRRTREVLLNLSVSRFIMVQDVPLFNNAVLIARLHIQSLLAEIIILAAIYAFTILRLVFALPTTLSTWYQFEDKIMLAGWYYALISLPIFQFLLIRWLWRLAVWTELLWKISGLHLQLMPIHPDKMGGLGFLGLAQIPFSLVSLAGGVVVSSYLVNNMIYRGTSLAEATGPMVGYVILATLVILVPIFAFTDKLVETRADGIMKYGDVGEEYVRLFNRKWVQGENPEGETILGSSDIQSLADMRNSFDIVQNMSVIAVDQKTAVIIIAASAIPMIPLFFIALPVNEIITRLLGIPR